MSQSIELSFEFFPPHTAEGLPALAAVARQLAAMQPSFFSVTYGAGGTTRDRTLNAVKALSAAVSTHVVPHISCMGMQATSVDELLRTYAEMGIQQLVVLRGDKPSGAVGGSGDFQYATQLVHYIRQKTSSFRHLWVAGYPEMHPEARSPDDDITRLREKINAGATGVITQYFFNADAFCDWRDRLVRAGIKVPIIPGIMPITQFAGLKRFSNLCGAEIPRWIYQRLAAMAEDNKAVQAFGLEVVSRLCEKLIQEGVPGLHFYTLNKADAALQICRELLFTPAGH